MHLKWEHESHVAYRKAVVVDSVIYNVVHNTKLWPLSFVIHNFLKKVINSLKTHQNYIINDIMNYINDKKPFPLH